MMDVADVYFTLLSRVIYRTMLLFHIPVTPESGSRYDPPKKFKSDPPPTKKS